MNCDFDYCIHNKDFKCRYDSVLINEYGICSECMLISIEKEELNEIKARQLKHFLEGADKYHT